MRKTQSKQVALKPFNSRIFYKNGIFKMDTGHNVFFNFKSRIKKYNVIIDTIDINGKLPVDSYVYCDVPYPWEIRRWFKIFSNRDKNILFTFESPLVNPFSQIRLLHYFFRLVYTWDDSMLTKNRYYKFYIPQLSSGIGTGTINFNNKKFLVAVLTNKSAIALFKLLSPYKRDLYIERKRAINYFESTIPNKFDLFGKGWSFKKQESYKGKINNKLDAISKYKFCLAFENTVAPGYITEKIFDCFKAGCVPIYLGAPNIEKYIPKSCFIDCRDFNGYGYLLHFLDSISEKKYNDYIKKAQEFLNKKSTHHRWFEISFDKIFIKAIS